MDAEPIGFGSGCVKGGLHQALLELNMTLSVEDKELAAQNLSHAELRKQVWELTRHNKTESSKVLFTVQTAAK